VRLRGAIRSTRLSRMRGPGERTSVRRGRPHFGALNDTQMPITMLIFQPHRRQPEVLEFAGAPSVRELDVVVGGPFEQIPAFFSIEHGGEVHRCVAFALRNRAGRPA
jgi:hypothetical protein